MSSHPQDCEPRTAQPRPAIPAPKDGSPVTVIIALAQENAAVPGACLCPGCGQAVVCLGCLAGLIYSLDGGPHTCGVPRSPEKPAAVTGRREIMAR